MLYYHRKILDLRFTRLKNIKKKTDLASVTWTVRYPVRKWTAPCCHAFHNTPEPLQAGYATACVYRSQGLYNQQPQSLTKRHSIAKIPSQYCPNTEVTTPKLYSILFNDCISTLSVSRRSILEAILPPVALTAIITDKNNFTAKILYWCWGQFLPNFVTIYGLHEAAHSPT